MAFTGGEQTQHERATRFVRGTAHSCSAGCHQLYFAVQNEGRSALSTCGYVDVALNAHSLPIQRRESPQPPRATFVSASTKKNSPHMTDSSTPKFFFV